MPYDTSRLANLDESGAVPESRMSDPLGCRSFVQAMILADQSRSRKRANVKGLIDGFPPYRQRDLIKAGRADACNVNWRTAEAYFNSATGAFYDLFSESDGYTTITLNGESPEQAEEYSRIATEEFNRLLKRDRTWDYEMQMSQYNMVLFGVGPLMFQDRVDWRCKHVNCANCLTMETSKSDAEQWECAAIIMEYTPPELYTYIRNKSAAEEIGWNVEAVKQSIILAQPYVNQGGRYLNWEWYEQQIKNQALNYAAQNRDNVIRVAHFFYREFPDENSENGMISHRIITISPQTDGDSVFLFTHLRRFENWTEVIHPMYYDHSGGGLHFSVTGMGVKMYQAMEYENRLYCNLADKTFAPDIIFRPTSANSKEKLNLQHFGDYAVAPTGLEVMQTPVGRNIKDGLAFGREMSGKIASNLSQYRADLKKDTGNPITATEATIDASEQARLGKTQFNRYYEQLDWLYGEKYRRATNLNLTDSSPGGKEALEFQKRCLEKGIPKRYLIAPESVEAKRVTGQGSAAMRLQSLQRLIGIVAMLPEDGRQNLLKDYIAANSGQHAVDNYYPKKTPATMASDQEAEAWDKVAGMKVGLPPKVTSSQNPAIYAEVYLQAASGAAESLSQGANPNEVFAFLQIAGPASLSQIQRLAMDPTRMQLYKALDAQWKKLTAVADKLEQHIQQQQQAQQAEQQKQQQVGQQLSASAQKVQGDLHIKAAKEAGQGKIKADKAAQDMQIKGAKASQDMALADAKTAANIHITRKAAEAAAETKKTVPE